MPGGGALSSGLGALRSRLPSPLRERLPAEDSLAAWLEALDEELAEVLTLLPVAALAAAVDELVALGAAAGPVLERAAALESDKRARKVVRRGIHLLRSRGVPLATPPSSGGRSVLRPLEGKTRRAFASAIDASGQRAIFLIEPAPGRTRVLQVLVSDMDGVVQVEALEGRRRDVRRLVREFLRGRLSAAELAPEAARTLLRRAEAARPHDAPPRAVDPVLLREVTSGADVATPGESVRERLGGRPMSGAEAEALLRVRVEAGRLAVWRLPSRSLSGVAGSLEEIERSPLVLSGLQKRERREEVLAKAAEAALAPPVRERLAVRLEESAALFEGAGDEDGARAALAIARQIREQEAPLRAPYLRSLLELSLEFARREDAQEGAGRLILPG